MGNTASQPNTTNFVRQQDWEFFSLKPDEDWGHFGHLSSSTPVSSQPTTTNNHQQPLVNDPTPIYQPVTPTATNSTYGQLSTVPTSSSSQQPLVNDPTPIYQSVTPTATNSTYGQLSVASPSVGQSPLGSPPDHRPNLPSIQQSSLSDEASMATQVILPVQKAKQSSPIWIPNDSFAKTSDDSSQDESPLIFDEVGTSTFEKENDDVPPSGYVSLTKSQPATATATPIATTLESTATQIGDDELEELLRLPRRELQQKCQQDVRLNALVCSQNHEMNRFWMHKTMHDATRRIDPNQVLGYQGFQPTDDWLMINFLKTSRVDFINLTDLLEMEELILAGDRPGAKKITRLPYRGLSLVTYDITNKPVQVPWLNLKFLDLSNNQLTDLPPTGLGQFPELQVIDFRHNQFQSFPINLGEMPKLEKVLLGGNPATAVTSEHLSFAQQNYPQLEYVFRAEPSEEDQSFNQPPVAQGVVGNLMSTITQAMGT